jgi:hypothetical protein
LTSGAASCLTSSFTTMFLAVVQKFTPTEEARREVADLEDDEDAALVAVGAKQALRTEKLRGVAANAESGGDLPVALAVPPSMAAGPVVERGVDAGPVVERGADGPLESIDCRQALAEEDSGPDFG